MKHVAIFLLALLCVVPLVADERPFLEITDKSGRTIEAQVLDKHKDEEGISVYRIRREDGGEFEIPITKLASDSISAIAREWTRQEDGVPVGFDSIYVKHVAVKQVGEKFRYFFHVRNWGDEPFDGEVVVTLHNAMDGITNGEDTFKSSTPIEPNLGRSAYMDAYTGPRSVHANASVVAYSYRVIEEGEVIAEGDGAIHEHVKR